MKKMFRLAVVALTLAMLPFSATGQSLRKISALTSAGTKAVKALTLSDAQMAAYVKESVEWMDRENPVATAGEERAIRLAQLTQGITDAEGIPLNFKVYNVKDVNAFACPDGSVRVFAGLMDIMDDDELMGVIGHEIGHVVKRHSKNAFKAELLTGALKDVVASTDGIAAQLTNSQLGVLGQSLMNARYSQKQEKEADNCGYDFLRQHGRNPWGMVMAFEKLRGMEGDAKPSYVQKMFSSHPDTQSRIDAMTRRCEKDNIKRPAK